jgi:tRNA-Thr(GGU) m(6)t(6)A37 methyltransferase TsaA
MDDGFGIREGEVAIELPAGFDAGLYFIGRIRTPWTRREDCPKSAIEARSAGIECTIELDERYRAGLLQVETFGLLQVLYWMDKARRDLIVQAPRHHNGALRGTFALRSPVRPNPIAASVVELRKVEGTRLTVVGLDCLDGTPLLDLKPWFEATRDEAVDPRRSA